MWDKTAVNRLNRIASRGTAKDMRSLIVENGESLPSQFKTTDQTRAGRFSQATPAELAIGNCSGADRYEKMSILVDAGLSMRLISLNMLFPTTSSLGSLSRDDLSHMRRTVITLAHRGGHINMQRVFSDTVLFLFQAYPDDLELYETLECAGLQYGEVDLGFERYKLLSFLATGLHRDTLEFVLSRGMKLSHSNWVSIGAGWSQESVDLCADCGIDLGDFDGSSCSELVLAYAIERGYFWPQKEPEDLWAKIINADFVDAGAALLEKGFPVPAGEFSVLPESPDTLDWAYGAGIKPGWISSSASRDVLIRSAKLGMVPHGVHSGANADWRTVSDSGDYEVIEAFLEMGVRELDPSLAIEKQRTDIIELFERYGYNTIPRRIVHGRVYVRDGAIVVPEGIEEIAEDAFAGYEASSVSLPESLRAIGDRAFELKLSMHDGSWSYPVKRLTIPRGVKDLGLGVCHGINRIVVYDTINPNAVYKLDPYNGCTTATVGWLGISPLKHFATSIGNASSTDFEVEVRSAETDEVKFRVYMPVGRSTNRVQACIYASSWGPNATFHFENVDGLFESISDKRVKLKSAIDRLVWPVDLPDDRRNVFEAYVKRFGKDAAKLLIDEDEIDVLKTLEPLGLVKKTNLADLLSYASEDGRAPLCAEYLEGLKATIGTVTTKSRERKKRETPSQIASRARTALLAGDASCIDDLTMVAKKIHPVDAVDLLECAVVGCDAGVVERMFEVFGDFEYKQNALVLALFCGKAETVELLREKHADLWGYVVPYFVPRDTPKKREGRLREYQPDPNAKAIRSSDTAWGLRVHNVGSREQMVAALQACAQRGVFDQYTLRRLAALPLISGYVDVARALINYVEGGQQVLNESIVRKKEIINSSCPEATIDYLIENLSEEQMRGCAARIWDTKKADSPYAARRYLKLLPYLDLSSFKERTALARIVAEYGTTDDLEALAQQPRFFTRASYEKALQAAQGEKRKEIVAWMLDRRNALIGGKGPSGLEL